MAAGGVLVGRGYVSIRPEFEGDWSRSVNARASAAGREGGAGFAGAFGKALGGALKGLSKGLIPAFGTSLVAAAAPAAGAAGVLATATLAAASAQTALKVGLSGVSDAVSEAFNPTSPEKFAEAMAKLSPNARSFVTELRGMKPALDGLKMGVQDRLFAQLDTTMATTAKATLPIFRNALTGSAGALNLMARRTLNTATGLGKSGALGTALSYANSGLYNLASIPGTIVQGLVQIGAAAGPSFGKLTAGAGGAFETLSVKMADAFASGGMQDFIETGVTVLMDLGRILGDAFATVGNIFKAASDAGGQALSVVGEVFSELRRITSLPEVQAQLRTIFASVAQIAAAVAPVLGSIIQAVLPLVAAIAPVIAQLATALGPVLSELATALGKALMPVITALAPVVTILGDALIDVVRAVMPLLQPIGQLLGVLVSALLPVLRPIIDIVLRLVKALVGPLMSIVRALVPHIEMMGKLFGQVFSQLTPLIGPLIAHIGELAKVFVQLYMMWVQTLMKAVMPMVPILMKVIGLVVQLAMDLFRQLMPSFQQLMQAGMQLLVALLPILPALVKITALALGLGVKVLTVLLPPIVKLAGFLIGGFASAMTFAVRLLTGLVTFVTGKVGPAFVWLRDKAVKPAWEGVRSVISSVWSGGIKPVFDTVKRAVGLVSDAFRSAKDAIKTQWDKLKGIAKAPVAFVIDTVFNKGIVKVWNAIASKFSAPTLDTITGFATGGILPGYTPGRDVHLAALSGGEAVMRPEWTRAVGPAYVNAMNAMARTGGVPAIRRMVDGGLPAFADGGIFGWVKNAASKGVDLAKAGASWLKDGVKASAVAGLKKIVEPLLKKISGSESVYRDMVTGIPRRMLKAIVDYSGKADTKFQAAGIGGGSYGTALSWARAQNGKPYLWGGVGPAGFDCSGFLGAIENVIRGAKPNSRRWATGAFSGATAPSGWVKGAYSPFRIGITNSGVGHTAGTLNGVNVESRGGDGVVVGSRARSFNSSLFTDWYGFKAKKFDAGGWLQPGVTAAVNATGRPEAILTGHQWQTMTAAATAPSLDGMELNVYVGGEKIRDIARAEVLDGQRRLVAVLDAS